MAAHKLIEIRCDNCDEAESEWNVTERWFRTRLRDDMGWHVPIGRDLCPRCKPQTVSR